MLAGDPLLGTCRSSQSTLSNSKGGLQTFPFQRLCRVKEPGSPVLAGDPRLIDELMLEMMGGSAWPVDQGAHMLQPLFWVLQEVISS